MLALTWVPNKTVFMAALCALFDARYKNNHDFFATTRGVGLKCNIDIKWTEQQNGISSILSQENLSSVCIYMYVPIRNKANQRHENVSRAYTPNNNNPCSKLTQALTARFKTPSNKTSFRCQKMSLTSRKCRSSQPPWGPPLHIQWSTRQRNRAVHVPA